jgi:outer membrane lipoprotein-sorting protein
MRSVFVAVFSIILVCVVPANGQRISSSPPQSLQPAQKDATALAIIGRMSAATGWTAANIPADVTAQATVTRYSAEVSDGTNVIDANFKLKGVLEARLEYTENGQTSTTIVHDKAGVIFAPDGSKQVLAAQSAVGLRTNILPFLTDLMQTSDPAVAIQYVGEKTVGGSQCYGVVIARQPDPSDRLAATLTLSNPITLWISSTTLLPMQIDYVRLAADNQYVVVHFSKSYSDYRTVNGVAVAFLQVESVEGQSMYRTQFTNVQFNSGLLDADFALPKL